MYAFVHRASMKIVFYLTCCYSLSRGYSFRFFFLTEVLSTVLLFYPDNSRRVSTSSDCSIMQFYLQIISPLGLVTGTSNVPLAVMLVEHHFVDEKSHHLHRQPAQTTW